MKERPKEERACNSPFPLAPTNDPGARRKDIGACIHVRWSYCGRTAASIQVHPGALQKNYYMLTFWHRARLRRGNGQRAACLNANPPPPTLLPLRWFRPVNPDPHPIAPIASPPAAANASPAAATATTPTHSAAWPKMLTCRLLSNERPRMLSLLRCRCCCRCRTTTDWP